MQASELLQFLQVRHLKRYVLLAPRRRERSHAQLTLDDEGEVWPGAKYSLMLSSLLSVRVQHSSDIYQETPRDLCWRELWDYGAAGRQKGSMEMWRRKAPQ